MRDFVNIKIEMTRAGMNVSDVAKEMNISPQALYQKLGGNTEFTLKDMNLLKKILIKHNCKNVSLDYLFGGDNDC